MPRYIDGFVIPMPKSKLAAYKKLATKAGKIWREHGALEVYECAADDLKVKDAVPFNKLAKIKIGETVVFSFIIYKSRRHRDQVNAKVMKDPRIKKMCGDKMPFDCKRMTYGGFKTIVCLK